MMIRVITFSKRLVLWALLMLVGLMPTVTVLAFPPNDTIANPMLIPVLPFSGTQPSDNAVINPGEPVPACDRRTPNWVVWYQYTAPISQTVRFFAAVDTAFSDSVWEVYTLESGTLTSRGCGYTNGSNGDHRYAEIDLQQGSTYLIGVGSAQQGTLTVTAEEVYPPFNDDPTTALAIPALPWTGSGSTRYAQQSRAKPWCRSTFGAGAQLMWWRSLWYGFVPTNSGMVTIDAMMPGGDPSVAIYSGTPGSLVGVGCNDDIAPGDFRSRLEVNLTAGTPYYLQIVGTGSNEPVQLSIQQQVTPPPTSAVTSFTLVNADTDQNIQPLTDGTTIDYSDLPTRFLTVRVDTNPPIVANVVLSLQGSCEAHTQTEASAPYSLFGDLPGANGGTDYNGWVAACSGAYSLTATPYTADGVAGTPRTVTFYVVDAPAPPTYTPVIDGLILIDATTDTVIGRVVNGDTIRLSTLPSRFLTVVASTDPAEVGSVQFNLNNGAHQQTENRAPYSMTGELPDESGGYDYNGWEFNPGRYTLEVTAFSGADGTGEASPPVNIVFTVVE